jgi:hypothetical protein
MSLQYNVAEIAQNWPFVVQNVVKPDPHDPQEQLDGHKEQHYLPEKKQSEPRLLRKSDEVQSFSKQFRSFSPSKYATANGELLFTNAIQYCSFPSKVSVEIHQELFTITAIYNSRK